MMFVDTFVKIKGSEEQLTEIKALLDKYGEDGFDDFNLEVARLALKNCPDHYADFEEKELMLNCYFFNPYEYNSPDCLELNLGADSKGAAPFSPDHADVLGCLLEDAFPGIEVNWLYRCDEWRGDRDPHGLFAKGGKSVNDYYRENYILETDMNDWWFEDLNELVKTVKGLTGKKNLWSFETCVEAMEEYQEDDDELRIIAKIHQV